MADLGQAYVQIVPSAKGISGSIQKELDPEASRAGESAGNKIGLGIKGKMRGMGKKLMAGGAIATAISVPLIVGIKKSLDAYEVQATAETKLTEIYKTRMGATEGAAQSTMKLASSLQKVGVVGDEVQLSGAQQLATFAKYPQTVNTLLPAMNNLLVQQKGLNGTAEDATSIANLMGKAMMGQTGALRRVGITFDENQEKVLKYGTESERAAMLAEVITQNVGNMNETMAQTDLGKMQQLKNTLGDAVERIGGALAPVLARLATLIADKIVPIIERVLNFIEAHPVIAKIAVALVGILAVGGPIVTMLGTIMTILPVLLGPIGLIIGAIAGAIAIGIALYKNWDKIKAILINIWNAIKTAAQKAWQIIKAVILGPVLVVINLIRNNWTQIKNFLTKLWNGIKTVANTVWNVIKNVTLAPVRAIKTGVMSVFNALKNGVAKVWNGIKTAITAPIEKAKEIVGGIINGIKNLFPLKFSKLFEGFKLPSINISKGKAPWGIGGKGEKPTFSLGWKDWYAKGGVFDSAAIIGIGEKTREAAIPLEGRYMRPFAQAIAAEMGGASAGGVVINVYGTDGMSVRELASEVKRQFIQEEKRSKDVWRR